MKPFRPHSIARQSCQRLLQNSWAFCLYSLCCLGSLAQAGDQLDLEGTTITGNQELPKALHIVPWKPAEAGDLAGRPMNSLVDEALAPIDRDVFLRELEFYEAVHSSR